jgi:hypothetical protein
MTKRRIFPRLVVLIFSAVIAISAADAPRVTRALLTTAENSLDERLSQLFADPLALVGPTRGVYLNGYGVVLTGEYNVARATVISFGAQPMNAQQKADLRKKKVGRLPELKVALRSALVAAASTFDTVPPTEQIVITLLLPRYSWEETSGFPSQIVAQGAKQQLIAAQKGGAALEQAVHFTEY